MNWKDLNERTATVNIPRIIILNVHSWLPLGLENRESLNKTGEHFPVSEFWKSQEFKHTGKSENFDTGKLEKSGKIVSQKK